MKGFDRALQMEPDDGHSLMGRGELRQVAGDAAGAKADFARARQLDPQNPEMWRRLGYLMVALGDVGRGLDLVAKSVAKFPDAPGYWNGLAWIRSSHPDPAARNAQQAIAAATRACELTGWSYPAFIDTLAAAFADAGRFDEAIAHQQKAVAAVPEAVRGEYEERLALYRQGKPFRKPFDLLRF
jgi:tetratricopeptide (TPR) repeat protein